MWLHVPGALQAYVLESAVSTLACETPFRETAGPSCMLNAKPMQQASYERELRKVGWMTRLYGLMFPQSILRRGLDTWMRSLEAHPVSPSPTPEKEQVCRTSDGSGPTLRALLRSSDPHGVFLKTSHNTSTSDWIKPTKTFAEWVSEWMPVSLRRLRLARRTYEGDSSFLPTPTAQRYGYNRGGESPNGSKRLSLQAMAVKNMWPTPTVKGGYNKPGLSKNSGEGLNTAVARIHGPGYLAPTFVEYLQGLPIGWTDLEH